MNAKFAREHLITGAALALAGVLLGGGRAGWFDPRQEFPLTTVEQPAATVDAGVTAVRPGIVSQPLSAPTDVRFATVRPASVSFDESSAIAGKPTATLETVFPPPAPAAAGGGLTVVNVNAPAFNADLSRSPAGFYLTSPGNQDRALSVALAGIERFTKAGFDLREDTFSGSLGTSGTAIISRHLVKGNDYCFCTATPTHGAEVSVSVYDPANQLAIGNGYQQAAPEGEGAVAFYVVHPAATGTYSVIVTMEKSPPGLKAPWALVYAYK